MKQEVEIYADGACSGNPGPGGWAACLIFGPHYKEISGYCPETTNQRMELKSAIEGLRNLKRPCRVKLYSDSAYLVNAFNLGWISNWRKNGWLTSKRKPVSNEDLWRELTDFAKLHEIEWIKVKGHSDNKYNNRCDALAKQAIEAHR